MVALVSPPGLPVTAPPTGYDTGGFFDEMFAPSGDPRPGYALLARRFAQLASGALQERQRAAERLLLNMGITFNVYGHEAGTEKIFPFDVVPRILEAAEWAGLERGIAQRIHALNCFLADIYGPQKILADGVVPRELVLSARAYLPECQGLKPPKGVFCHVSGTDLVRDKDGRFYVLEDNLRCPSGVSYVLENRQVMKRTFPQVFEASRVRPVDSYPSRLRDMLQYVAPAGRGHATCVVLTPGRFNSAYFEHSFLAQQMGMELVEGRDLVVHKGVVAMRTTKGYERVDVIYRRIDDTFLDPTVFRRDSMIGVPGLMDVYRKGRVTLANAPGTGVADDKVIYAFVPDMIRYYLGEDAILPNVPTYVCQREKDLEYVCANIESLVVKAANESGGYGMIVGPQSTKEQCALFRDKVRAEPRNYIAQPMLSLSRVPTLVDGKLEGRHVDLRPYALFGESIWTVPGGLTRVALQKGSCIVNSSQGGGSKDTWVLDAPREGAPC
jgi:uncharacterized circularly permuted ATP-grasp superfamily protein